MESEAASRRINMIASHFNVSEKTNDDAFSTSVLPMNCNGNLNYVIRRGDNRMHFARQASDSLGYFMRQASDEEASSSKHVSATKTPLFSRCAHADSNPTNSMVHPMAHACTFAMPEPPKFARPSSRLNDGHLLSQKSKCTFGGREWSPRLDVAESERKYVVTVEIPCVNVNDIIVEVDDQKLSVKGMRSVYSRKVGGCSNDWLTLFHRREMLHGPYEVAWPLPAGVNKDEVSAQFLNGFLQITVPKL